MYLHLVPRRHTRHGHGLQQRHPAVQVHQLTHDCALSRAFAPKAQRARTVAARWLEALAVRQSLRFAAGSMSPTVWVERYGD